MVLIFHSYLYVIIRILGKPTLVLIQSEAAKTGLKEVSSQTTESSGLSLNPNEGHTKTPHLHSATGKA